LNQGYGSGKSCGSLRLRLRNTGQRNNHINTLTEISSWSNS
jgi:hypothetical protein